jgi:hypothetical protein
MTDHELLALAAELRQENPALSLEQALDAAAAQLADVLDLSADWEQRRLAMRAQLAQLCADWDSRARAHRVLGRPVARH